MTSFEPEGWIHEDGDPDVGIFGDAWYHDACTAQVDEYQDAETFVIAHVRLNDMNVRTVTRLVCQDCAAEVEVTEDDFMPTDEWFAAEAAAQAEWEAYQNELDSHPIIVGGSWHVST